MKLSLCVIAGNVERYIERFLDAFSPLADEIIIVRATGNQPPDQTLAIARRRGCKTGIYSNVRDWPHVDDFAAARNLSFSMASHEVIMWADTDDLIDAASIAAIRDAITRMPENCCGIEVPYQVPEDGITVWRERIIRAGSATWVSPIHEHLKFAEDAQLARISDAMILHAATGERKPNDERNLRILESIPAAERSGSHRFHLFQSLRAVGRLDDAAAEVVSLLQDPAAQIGQAERYELFIAAAQMSPDHAMRSHLILQALSTDPTRREAFGELALCMIGQGRPADALAYTTAMRAIPATGGDWNTRRKYYGWLGESLHGMGLRALGRIEEADATERNHFIRHGARISLLHATRGRVRQAAACRRKWLETAADTDAVEHIFALDLDDPDAMLLTVHNHVMLDGQGGPVAAWNLAAGKSAGAVLVQLSDDWEPFQGWDTAILSAIGDLSKPAVLAISDGHRTDDLLCMAILTRARYQAQGHLFHPEFFSMFSDNWFSECAFRDGVVIDARDWITFEHLHPAFGKGEMDATYQRSNDPKNYHIGGGTYQRLRDGVLTPYGMDGWCDFRALYYAIAELLPENGTFAEIGSWMGQSAVTLCQRLQDIGKNTDVYCIDTFAGEQNQPAHLEIVASMGGSTRAKFEENIKAARVDGMIDIMQEDSAAAAECFPDGYFDGVFIDAAHDYESVRKDVAAWFPKVKPGGILAGHDYPCDDVKRAVDEHAAAHGWTVTTFGRCWIRKTPKP